MLRSLFISVILASSASFAFAAEAGRVVFVAGAAQVGNKAATVDLAVQEGDQLVTGADGYIYMKTVDDGFLILRPKSKARVTTYHIDSANPANTRVKLELLSGVARSISGNSVKQARQNFRFNTPVAAIGVRGTDFIVHTNAEKSWVSVVSGGVVVAAFSGACGPEGSGPCEGSASRELFAGRSDLLLQVERGQNVPQLLQSTVIAPELKVPARNDEPIGKVGAANGDSGGSTNNGANHVANNNSAAIVATVPVVVAPPVAIVDVALDPTKNPVPLPGGAGTTPGRPVETPTLPPVVVVDPVPVTPPVTPPVVDSGPEVLWGRWQAVAGVNPDPAVQEKLHGKDYTGNLVIGSYEIARVTNSAFVMPNEGKASFAMVDSEAVLQKTGSPALAATVSNAKLNVDFSTRSFTTSLTVSNSLGQLDFSSRGDVMASGGLQSTILTSSKVAGYLGGANAGEAVYLFKGSTLDLTANGVVRWSR